MDSKFFKIGDIFNVEKGLVQSSKNIEGQFNFITASAEWKTHNEYSHDCEALVFAAGAAGSLGRTHYVNGKFIASDLCFVLTLKDELIDKVDMKFYFYYFNLNKDTIVKSIATGTSKLAINMRNFINYCIPLPSIEYQKLAREKIEEVEPRINKLNLIFGKNLDYITRLRHSILLEAIQGKLVPQDPNDEPVSVLLEKIKKEKEMLIKEGKIKKEKPLPPITQDEIPFEIPKGWEWVRLGEVTNYAYNETLKPDEIDEEEWVLELEDIEKDTSRLIQVIRNKDRKSKSNKNRFYKGDVLYGKLRPYLKKVLVAPEDGVCSTEIIPFRGYGNIESRYIMYIMKSPYIDKIVNSITHGMNMPRLGTKNALELLIPLPPINEQKRIVEKVDQLMALYNELERNIKQSKKDCELLMQSVLQEAFKEA